MWQFPPTRRSIEHSVTSHANGANHLLTCSGFVNTSKTSPIGASNSRVVTISRSFGNSMTADPCRLGVTAALLVVVVLAKSRRRAQTTDDDGDWTVSTPRYSAARPRAS